MLPGLASPATADSVAPAYYPSGPQTDVPVSTVTSGGWQQCYLDDYSSPLSSDASNVLSACTGDYLMLAGRPTGSDTLSLLAAAPRADVIYDTGGGQTTTHEANGTAWYFSAGASWGFAPAGDSVSLTICDTSSGSDDDLRLCWHTVGYAGGWRLGIIGSWTDPANNDLNYGAADGGQGDDYERVVYETNSLPQAQSITYSTTAPSDAVVGGSYTPAATGGASGNAVVLSVDASSSGVCSMVDGTVTFDHVGTCTVDADQAGSDGYSAATQAQQNIAVGQAPQSITYSTTAPTDAVLGATYTPAATGGASGNAVVLSVDASSSGVCSMVDGTVTFDHVGTCTVDADQAGNDDYSAATQAQQDITVGQASQTVAFTSTAPTSAVVGDTYTPTTSGGASGNAVNVSVDEISGDNCTISGGVVTLAHPGSCVLDADQAGNSDYAAAIEAQQTVGIAQGTTSTTVAVTAHELTATVSVATGAGTPSGSVDFTVGGVGVGTAPVSGGVATLAYDTPTGAARTVAAEYQGDRDFAGSSASITRHDPRITAHVSSSKPKSAAGWYRTPVKVSFTCQTNGAALVAACPAPVRRTRNGAGQSVTRTIKATDGGIATATVTGIKIDTVAPKVRIAGVNRNATYVGTPAAHCVARDGGSGVASCRVTRRVKGQRVTWTAVATDNAGNTGRATVRIVKARIYYTGAPLVGGRFQVQAGRSYTLVVENSRVRPLYYDAAVDPRRPSGYDKPFLKIGKHRWALGITMGSNMSRARLWSSGVKIGKTMYLVRLRVS